MRLRSRCTRTSRLNLRPLVAIAACAVACACATEGCESREQMMREAEDRANYWGYPAHHVVRDLVYADYNGRRLKLDLYRPPPGAAAPAPGIVVVRGGAFRVGDKIFFGYIAGQLAEAGFVTASIEYRTSNEARDRKSVV